MTKKGLKKENRKRENEGWLESENKDVFVGNITEKELKTEKTMLYLSIYSNMKLVIFTCFGLS